MINDQQNAGMDLNGSLGVTCLPLAMPLPHEQPEYGSASVRLRAAMSAP
jgi:hypothetical protein